MGYRYKGENNVPGRGKYINTKIERPESARRPVWQSNIGNKKREIYKKEVLDKAEKLD